MSTPDRDDSPARCSKTALAEPASLQRRQLLLPFHLRRSATALPYSDISGVAGFFGQSGGFGRIGVLLFFAHSIAPAVWVPVGESSIRSRTQFPREAPHRRSRRHRLVPSAVSFSVSSSSSTLRPDRPPSEGATSRSPVFGDGDISLEDASRRTPPPPRRDCLLRFSHSADALLPPIPPLLLQGRRRVPSPRDDGGRRRRVVRSHFRIPSSSRRSFRPAPRRGRIASLPPAPRPRRASASVSSSSSSSSSFS